MGLSSVDLPREAIFPKVSILYERASILECKIGSWCEEICSEHDAGVSCSLLEVPQSITSQPFLEYEPKTRMLNPEQFRYFSTLASVYMRRFLSFEEDAQEALLAYSKR